MEAQWKERHPLMKQRYCRRRRTLYLQSFRPAPACVSFFVQPYPLLAIPLQLEQIFTLESCTRQICLFHQVWNPTRGPDDTFGPEIGTIFLLFPSQKCHNKGARRIEPFTDTHTHACVRTHLSLKGERRSPPSLFASSKSP